MPTASSSATPRPLGAGGRGRAAPAPEAALRRPARRAADGGVLPRRDLFRGKGYLPIRLMQFAAAAASPADFCAVSAVLRPQALRPRHRRGAATRSRRRTASFLFFVDDNIASDHEGAGRAVPRADPAEAELGEPGQPRRHARPDADGAAATRRQLGNVMGFESITRAEPARDAQVAEHPGLLRLQARRCASCASTACRPGRPSRSATTTTRPSRSRATVDFALDSKLHLRRLQHPDAVSEHAAVSQLEQEGRLLYDGKWWLHPEYRFNSAAFVPHAHERRRADGGLPCGARTRFNSFGSLLSRFADPKTHLRSVARIGAYWYYTPDLPQRALQEARYALRSALTASSMKRVLSTSTPTSRR